MPIKKGNNTEVPAWLEEELKQMSDPDESVHQRFEYLRRDFVDSFSKWATDRRAAPSAGYETPLLVFSKAGELIRKTGEIITRSISAAIPSPGFGTRSSAGTIESGRSYSGRSCILPLKNAGLEAYIYQDKNRFILEINLFSLKSGKEIRPFHIDVSDEKNRVLDTRDVHAGELPPKYIDPQIGQYRFNIDWDEGCARLVIAIE